MVYIIQVTSLYTVCYFTQYGYNSVNEAEEV